MTQEQKDRIRAITDEWESEMKKMEQETPASDGRHLDGPRTTAHTILANKYMPRIQEIIE